MVLCATCIQVSCIKFLVLETWTVCHRLNTASEVTSLKKTTQMVHCTITGPRLHIRHRHWACRVYQ